MSKKFIPAPPVACVGCGVCVYTRAMIPRCSECEGKRKKLSAYLDAKNGVGKQWRKRKEGG